jgi:hypothetical protein
MKRAKREGVVVEQATGNVFMRTARAVGRKAVAGVMAGVMLVTGTATACAHPPLEREITIVGPSTPESPETRAKVGDGVPQTTVIAPVTPGESATTKISREPLKKIVCRGMLFLSPGLIVYNPVVDSLTGKPGLYPRDIRPTGEELPDELPQEPGPNHQWVAENGDKISDQDLAGTNKCQLLDVKIIMARTVCPEGSEATYVPVDFNPDTVPLNRAPESATKNPNYFHQTYASTRGITIPGLSDLTVGPR